MYHVIMPSEAHERLVSTLLTALPELEEECAELADAYGEDLGPVQVLNELASLVTPLLEEAGGHGPFLTRCFDAVELALSDDDPEIDAIVAFGFLDGLSPLAQSQARTWLGPRTAGVLLQLDRDELDPDSALAEEIDSDWSGDEG